MRGVATAAFVTAMGIGAAVGSFVVFSRDLPTLETLSQYNPPTVTVVYDSKGRLLGEIYEKRRYVIPYEEIPEVVKQAFIAAEDAAFWSHGGVDPMGIVRAMVRNTLKGRMSQGASTITQQVARNFLLSNEKKLKRKVQEMILSGRIEKSFTKQQILWLYLNQIYLGSGSYGVEAASRVYFGKHVQDLDLAEASMLAGLPQRPSDYSPHLHYEKAKTRQKYVLDQMVDNKFIGRAQADEAFAEPPTVVQRTNEFLVQAPHFTEYVRRHLVDTYGFDRVYNEGLVATATCDLDLQKTAQEALIRGVTENDQGFGWRGTKKTLAPNEISTWLEASEKEIAAAEAKEADPTGQLPSPAHSTLKKGKVYEGVITEVKDKHAILGVGRNKVIVGLSTTKWAFKPDTDRSWNKRELDSLTRTFKPGEVVDVQIEANDWKQVERFKSYTGAGAGPYAAGVLYQAPELEGAILSYRLTDGAVMAMVGGWDFTNSELNRAIQSRRQVGSTFKPFVYAAAIRSRKFATGTMVQDAPLVMNIPGNELWKPGNYGADYMGNISLRRALALSRNVCTVRVLDAIGMQAVYDVAKAVGIESEIDLFDPNCRAPKACLGLSAGLGSSSLTMLELARAYSVFPTLGRLVQPYFIEEVKDNEGKSLEKHDPVPFKQVLDPAVAGIGLWLLQEVTSAGTAAKASSLGLHTGGKTGTTNDFRDAWFVGFTARVLTATWVGYDQPRSMGQSSTGGHLSLPIWMDYMKVAVPRSDNPPFPPIPGVTWVSIDESTGRVANGGRSMPYLPGTAPDNTSIDVGQKLTEDLLIDDF